MGLLLHIALRALQCLNFITTIECASFMRYLPKEGEQLVYEDIYIPDVD
jgi:hypothetical protein